MKKYSEKNKDNVLRKSTVLKAKSIINKRFESGSKSMANLASLYQPYTASPGASTIGQNSLMGNMGNSPDTYIRYKRMRMNRIIPMSTIDLKYSSRVSSKEKD